MAKNLPVRPNLEHLRRQAKDLLAALRDGDSFAIATIQEHLPSARNQSAAQVRPSGLRLADAQSAIARKTGFASWPQLSRHVDQLRSLEGDWAFAKLEIDGCALPAEATQSSRVLIDGDRFRTETPEGVYEGVFNINVEAQPLEIDIEFVAGPEAGNWNYGIYRLVDETLQICLDLNGRSRPTGFHTTAGSGHAFETLIRTSRARPTNVEGGTPISAEQPIDQIQQSDAAGFEYVESQTLAKLSGAWTATRVMRDGKELPKAMIATGRRLATKNSVRVSFGGQTVIDALVRLNEITNPIHVDYLLLEGPAQGAIQQGLFQWDGTEGCFCMGSPGGPRPDDFQAPLGSGRTLSQWRRKD